MNKEGPNEVLLEAHAQEAGLCHHSSFINYVCHKKCHQVWGELSQDLDYFDNFQHSHMYSSCLYPSYQKQIILVRKHVCVYICINEGHSFMFGD